MYLIDLINKNKEVVEGKDVKIGGEIVKIGALSSEEKEQMIQEGIEFGNQITSIDDVETKVIDIEDGRLIVAVIDNDPNLEGNSYSLWYPWRGTKIVKEWEKLNQKSQEDLKAVLEAKDLWQYVEEWL